MMNYYETIKNVIGYKVFFNGFEIIKLMLRNNVDMIIFT